ncbi:unnamed protein product [Linum trigynum]|uniref:RNase H type-1 domain-containing protein n=1 Tax=Linum trigynum TaxID=586398 RepID=A0AAV2ES60_9ROSI
MRVVSILWRIWRSRNWVVFEGKQYGFPALMRQFSQQVEEWVGLPLEASSPLILIPERNHAGSVEPDNGIVCHWDGATRKGSHSAGGWVLYDGMGNVLLASGVQFPGMDDPAVVELLVLREAVLWCLDHGFTEVRFEGDAKMIIDKINKADTRDSQLGAVLEEVVHAVGSTPGYSVRFIGRRRNRVAHLVARKALALYPTLNRWFDFRTCLLSRM